MTLDNIIEGTETPKSFYGLGDDIPYLDPEALDRALVRVRLQERTATGEYRIRHPHHEVLKNLEESSVFCSLIGDCVEGLMQAGEAPGGRAYYLGQFAARLAVAAYLVGQEMEDEM